MASRIPQKQEKLGPEGYETPPDRPLLDLSDAAVKELIRTAKKRGYVTHDQINERTRISLGCRQKCGFRLWRIIRLAGAEPESFATLPYFGVNMFKFTNAAGKATFARYQLQPVAGAKYITDDAAAKVAPDHLMKEIGQRVQKEPVKFRVMLQLAGPGDKLDDPSVAWPDSRQTAELGTVTLTRVTTDERSTSRWCFSRTHCPTASNPPIEASHRAAPPAAKTFAALSEF